MNALEEWTQKQSSSLNRALQRPPVRRLLGLAAGILAIASSVLMVAGVASYDGLKFVLYLVAGAVVGAISLLLIGKIVEASIGGWSSTAVFALAGGLIVAGATITVLAATVVEPWPRGWPILPMVGLIVTVVGLIVGNRCAGDAIRRRPLMWLVDGFLLTVVGLLVLLSATPTAVHWAVAAAAWIAGLTILKLALTPWIDAAGTQDAVAARARSVVAYSIRAAAVATLMVLAGGGGRSFIAAGWLLVLALSVGGVAGLLVPGVRTAAIATVGVTSLAMGTFFLMRLLPDWTWLALIVGATMVVVGAFFVFRGEAVVAVLVFGALFAWVTIERVGEPIVAENPIGSIAVFGDSFMAGQGAERFVEHTNSRAPGANMCRRSPRSFAFLVAAEFRRVAFDYACNGAETSEIAGTSRHLLGPVETAPDGKAQLYDAFQFRPFAIAAPDDVELVLVTGGGNDAEFSTIVSACLLPSSCDDESRRLLTLAEAIVQPVEDMLVAIADNFPHGPPIVVVPYPSYVGATKCGNALGEAEVAFANVFIGRLNESIHTAVNAVRADGHTVHYFDEIDRAYVGRMLCDDEPAANLINLLPPDGPVLDRLTPDDWHEGSAHPNETGHACTAQVLADWLVAQGILTAEERIGSLTSCVIHGDRLDEHRERVDKIVAEVDKDRHGTEWRTAHPGEVRRSGPDDPDLDRVVCDDEECFSADAWAADRAGQLVPALMWRLGLVMLGGLLTALAFARRFSGVGLLAVLIPDRATR